MAKFFSGQLTLTGGDDNLWTLIQAADNTVDCSTVASAIIQAGVSNANPMTVGFNTAVGGISLDAKQWLELADQGGANSVQLKNTFVKGTATQKVNVVTRGI